MQPELDAKDATIAQLTRQLWNTTSCLDAAKAMIGVYKRHIARLRAGEDATPHDEAVWPTPGQWIYRWNRMPAERRLEAASRVVTNAREAQKCFLMDHQGRLQATEAERNGAYRERVQDLRAALTPQQAAAELGPDWRVTPRTTWDALNAAKDDLDTKNAEIEQLAGQLDDTQVELADARLELTAAEGGVARLGVELNREIEQHRQAEAERDNLKIENALMSNDQLELARARNDNERLRQHILDIDAHATPYGDIPNEPGYAGTYRVTAGALHRALGTIGHTAPNCQAEAERDQLGTAVERVREIHPKELLADGLPVCGSCRDAYEDPIPWPCPTIAALDQETP